jgi:pimeloyl-ACP methyl ester carboxylesterase
LTEHHPSSSCATPWPAWVQSIINGAVGDYLHAAQNGLGIDMALYVGNRALPLSREALLRAHPQPTAKLCVLVHGLGCNEGSWAYADPERPGYETSYGAGLAADLGYTPLFVRYNTGLAIGSNGVLLADLLADLLAAYPLPVEELVLIGHSMGGLVIRHACHEGALRDAAWLRHVQQLFYLGSPHHGAPLALLSDLTAQILHAVPNPITRLVGDIFHLRSQGIKDLRAAPLQAAEHPDVPAALPWMAGVRHHLVVGTLAEDPEHLLAALLGDGLVPVPPAPPLGPGDQLACFPRTDHLQLARDPAVYRQLRQWCAADPRRG